MTIEELNFRLAELDENLQILTNQLFDIKHEFNDRLNNLEEKIQELSNRIDALDYCVDTNQYYE